MGIRTRVALAAVILAAVAIGSAANIAVWLHHSDGPVRLVSNTTTVMALPVWIPLRLIQLSPASLGGVGIVIANTMTATLWTVVGWMLLAARRRLARPAPGLIESVDQGSIDRGSIDPSRRAFLTNSAAGVIGVGAVAAPGYAAVFEPSQLVVRRYEMLISGLLPSLEGLRVVHFSDPHLGPRMPSAFIRRAIDEAIGLRPDLVALTGDYIHNGEAEIERVAKMLRPLVEAATIGAAGVLGNHDWYGNGPRVSAALRAAGVRMIDNASVRLDPDTRTLLDDPHGRGLALVGLGDLSEDEVDTQRAFAGIDPGTPRLVLAHHPDTAELSELRGPGSPRMDLMLSGHTHGGQVRIPFIGTPVIPSDFGQRYAGGLVAGPSCPVIVSRAVGMSVLPVRFGVPPEIGLIILRAAPSSEP